MKKLSIICTLLTLMLCQSVFARVLWQADPNASYRDSFRFFDTHGNRNPTGNQCRDNPNRQPTVTNPTDRTYGKFWRITKPSQRKRAEFAWMDGNSNSYIPRNGSTVYIGWRWRTNASGGTSAFQWKTANGGQASTQNYPFNLSYDGNNLHLNAYGPAYPTWNQPGSINKRRTQLWSQRVNSGQWVTIVLGIKLSRNANDGYIELWFNGRKQTLRNSLVQDYRARISGDGKRAYHKTFDGSQVLPKWGSYGQDACNQHIVTDYDDMRAATTYREAAPSSSAPPSGGVTPPSGYVDLRIRHSNKCMDVSGHSRANGGNIQQWNCSSHSNQKWRFESKGGGWYSIRGQQSNKCVDIRQASSANGANVEQYSCHDGTNQQFRIENRNGGWLRLRSRHSNKCIDVAGASTSNGANLSLWTCHSNHNQQFRFD